MGLVYSAFCMISFCFERVLTWACCACALISLLCGIMLLMVYGISIGYGYAQQELAGFAKKSRDHLRGLWTTDLTKGPQYPHTPWRRRRRSGGNASDAVYQPNVLPATVNPMGRSKPLYEVQPNRNYRGAGVPPEALDAPDALDAPETPYAPPQAPYAPPEDPEAQQDPEGPEAQQDPEAQSPPEAQQDLEAPEAQQDPEALSPSEAPYAREVPRVHETQDVPDDPYTKRITYRPLIEPKQTPFVIILPTERPPEEPEMQPHEKELARRIIGRFRRSKYFTDYPKSRAAVGIK